MDGQGLCLILSTIILGGYFAWRLRFLLRALRGLSEVKKDGRGDKENVQEDGRGGISSCRE
jgi:hypothetical protein